MAYTAPEARPVSATVPTRSRMTQGDTIPSKITEGAKSTITAISAPMNPVAS
jgi:hypothetical protein